MKTFIRTLLFLLLILPLELHAQYYGERVLEKGFEQTDFFFTPSYLIPYGLGSFKTTSPGLINDPLLNVIINPARLGLDTLVENYIYADFRSARNTAKNGNTYYPMWSTMDYRASSDLYYYPRLYLQTRRELEPLFSGAYIGRPLPETSPDFVIGLTYQYTLQDEKYYNVPQDIYRAVVGYDYSGTRSAASDAIPIVDKYSGKDNMNHAGHFISAFVRYTLPVNMDVGLKVSRAIFTRAGAFGSSNLWESSQYSSSSSFWSNMEIRDQGYSHWDIAGGVDYHLNARSTIGVTVGHLWGDATQALTRNDSSYYNYSSTSYASYYNRSGNTSQGWTHNGRATYFGIDFTSNTSATNTLTLSYRREQSTVDLGLSSAILDTSYSTYTYDDAGKPYTSYSHSYLSDMRNGSGSHDVTKDRLMASFQWKIDPKLTVSLGAQVEWYSLQTTTSEGVLVGSRSAYWSTKGTYDYHYAQDESKTLFWTFTTKRSSFHVPVFVTIQATSAVQVLLGLNRTMAQWKIDDVTLAIFRYRNTLTGSGLKREENFGERSTAPTEEVSDVRTTFLAGLTLAPSEKFQFRVLAVPNFADSYDGPELSQIQFWVGIMVTP
jgi:hypothetical protein